MYAATATICVAIEKLKQFPDGMKEPLLIKARSELEIARNLLESRWRTWSSIYWKHSNAATKRFYRTCYAGLNIEMPG